MLSNCLKEINKKEFSFHREKIIRCLFDKGNFFFGLKIDCSSEWFYDKKMLISHKEIKKEVNFIAEAVLPSINLIDFSSLNVRVSKDSKGEDAFTIYILLSCRALVEFNDSIIYHIQDSFPTQEYLVKVNYLEKFDQIINFWDFMVEDANRADDLSNFYIFYFQKLETLYGHMADFLNYNGSSFPSNVGYFDNHVDNRIENLNFEHKVVCLDNIFELSSHITDFLYNRFPYQITPGYVRLLILEHSDSVMKKIKEVPALLPKRTEV